MIETLAFNELIFDVWDNLLNTALVLVRLHHIFLYDHKVQIRIFIKYLKSDKVYFMKCFLALIFSTGLEVH